MPELPAVRSQSTWFNDQTKPLWEKYLLPRKAEITRYLEIGMWDGCSMRWMLENVLTKPGDSAVGIDHYPGKREKDAALSVLAEENMRANLAPWSGAFTHAREPSQTYLRRQPMADPDWAVSPFDLIFVDGAHQGRAALEDMVLSYALLRRGGLLIIDDLNRHYGHGRANVWEAAHAFTMTYVNLFRWVYREERQWAIERRA